MRKLFFCFCGLFILIYGCATISTESTESESIEWDISLLDTGREADYLTDSQKDLLLEINKVRSDPKKYAEYRKRTLSSIVYNNLLKMETAPPLIVEEGLVKSVIDLFNAGLTEPNRGFNNTFILNALNEYGSCSGGYHYSFRGSPYGNFSIEILLSYAFQDHDPRDGPQPFLLDSKLKFFGIARGYSVGYKQQKEIIFVVEKYTPR